MISLIQSIRLNVTIFDDIDTTSFGFQEFLNVFDKDNTSQKISSRYTNKAWVSHYASITRASKIRNLVERVASQSSRIEKDKKRSRSTS